MARNSNSYSHASPRWGMEKKKPSESYLVSGWPGERVSQVESLDHLLDNYEKFKTNVRNVLAYLIWFKHSTWAQNEQVETVPRIFTISRIYSRKLCVRLAVDYTYVWHAH